MLVERGEASPTSVPAPLQKFFTDAHWRRYPIHVLEYEGKIVYVCAFQVFLSSPTTGMQYDFYDADGKPIAVGMLAKHVFPRDTMMTPEEWEALPRVVCAWWK